MGAESVRFDDEKRRDAQIRQNTQDIQRHRKLGLIVGGYLLAEGSTMATDIASLLV